MDGRRPLGPRPREAGVATGGVARAHSRTSSSLRRTCRRAESSSRSSTSIGTLTSKVGPVILKHLGRRIKASATRIESEFCPTDDRRIRTPPPHHERSGHDFGALGKVTGRGEEREEEDGGSHAGVGSAGEVRP